MKHQSKRQEALLVHKKLAQKEISLLLETMFGLVTQHITFQARRFMVDFTLERDRKTLILHSNCDILFFVSILD